MASPMPASPAPGHDILARYLCAYASARQLSDLERPWGLGDDALDSLWMRLSAALKGDPRRLDRIVEEDLSPEDREHIAATILPLLFALPLRAYPAELRAVRSGPRLLLALRHFSHAEPPTHPEHDTSNCPWTFAAPNANGKDKRPAKHHDDALGYLPAALSESVMQHLRRTLHFKGRQRQRTLTISCGGRRRRVKVMLTEDGRGATIRFLARVPSPVDPGKK